MRNTLGLFEYYERGRGLMSDETQVPRKELFDRIVDILEQLPSDHAMFQDNGWLLDKLIRDIKRISIRKLAERLKR